MAQTIKLTHANRECADRERTVAEAIRLVADTAAARESRSGFWSDRFAVAMEEGISLPGLEAIRHGQDPRDALADSFGLRLGAIPAGRDEWGNPGLTNTAHKLARLLIADKAVGLDLSSALPDREDGESPSDDVVLSRVVGRLREIVEDLGVTFSLATLALRCDHPNIREFFDMYLDDSPGAPMLAVKMSAEFMEAVRAGGVVPLRHAPPACEKNTGMGDESPGAQPLTCAELNARALWRHLVSTACRTPKVHLILENCMRPASPLGHFEVTDAVSPYLLQTIPAESAQMIIELDLSRFIDRRGMLVPDRLEQTVRDGLRLADNLIDEIRWPLDAIKSDACAYRRIAFTVQGIGEAAVRMRLDAEEFAALQQLYGILRRVAQCAYRQSLALAQERDPFPGLRAPDLYNLMPRHGLEDEIRANIRAHGTRNSQILVLAPFSVIPLHCPPSSRAHYANFLPLLRFAHTLAFRRPPFLEFMHGEDLAQFLRLSWAYFSRSELPRK